MSLETPQRYKEQITQMKQIKSILNAKSAVVNKLFVFRIDRTSMKQKVGNSMDKDIDEWYSGVEQGIEKMKTYSSKLFGISTVVKPFHCKDGVCGIVKLSPTT